MELFGTAVVGALATAMVTGAGQEAGRRGVGPLAALLGRLRLRRHVTGDNRDNGDNGDGGGEGESGGEPPAPPGDPERARQVAEEIVRAARDDEAIACLLAEFARSSAGLPAARIVSYAPFVDRADQLAEVRRLITGMTDRPLLVLLFAPPGTGTSALAKQLSPALADLLPHGHLHLDLAGPGPGQELTPATAATELLLDLGAFPGRIPPDLPGKLRELRQRLAGEPRRLLVLDNARSAEQVAPLLLAAPGSLTVVTASHRMPALVGEYGARVLHVGPLTDHDAEELLAQVAGPDRFLAGGAAAREAARRCGGHPRTLCHLGALAQLDQRPDWAAIAQELTAPAAGPGDGTVTRAYPDLSPGAARLHRLLGRLPQSYLGMPAIAALSGRVPEETGPLVDELTGHQLVERAGDRYRQTTAAHRHAAVQRESDAADAVRAWVDWSLRVAAEAQTTVMPGRWYLGRLAAELAGQTPEHGHRAEAVALQTLRRERAALVAAVRTAVVSDLPELAWQLCESMWALHLRLGFHDDCLTTHALGVRAARECGDHRALARMLVQRGFSYLATRRYADAEAAFEQALAAEPGNHPRGKATALESLGLLRLAQARPADAEHLFRKALPFAERAADPRALALLRHHIGRALRGQRRHPAAFAELDGALAAIRALPVPDRYNEGRVLTSIGETRLASGDPAGAAGPLDEALRIMTAEGALLQEAAVAELRARCEPDHARRRALWRRAWELHEATGDAGRAARMQRLISGEETEEPEGPEGEPG